jgi:hypothetical protein
MTLMVVSPLLAQRGGLTDEQVDAAIAAAKQPGWTSLFVEAKGRFGAYYSVLLQGSVGRTMDLARDTFESYKPLTAATVPATVKAPAVTLAVVRHRDSNGVIAIKNVVLMPPGAGRDAAIQPLPPGRLFQDRRPRFSGSSSTNVEAWPRVRAIRSGWLLPLRRERPAVRRSGDRRGDQRP